MKNDFFIQNAEINPSCKTNRNLRLIIEEANENNSESKERDFCSTEIHNNSHNKKSKKTDLSRNFTDMHYKKRNSIKLETEKNDIGMRYVRNSTLNRKRKISIVNGTPRTQEDLERFLDPMFILKSTRIQKFNEFDYEIQEELNNVTNLRGGRIDTENQLKNRRNAIDAEYVGRLEAKVYKSWFFTILSVINCIIRYTIIQLPYCIKILGLFYGSFTVLTVATISLYSVYLLIKISEKTGENSYSQFAYKWFKLKGKILILILNILSSFGSCLSYVIIFLKFIPNLIASKMGADSILADKLFLSVVLSVLLIIYCYQNDVSGIKSAAYWGVFGINLLLFLVIYDLLSASKEDVLYDWTKLNVMNLSKKPTDIISCISCIILSFSFHTYTFSIYECLSEKNTKSMLITTGVGLFASMAIYLLFGCVGYILYVDQVDEYYILNRDHDSVLNYLENIAFVVNVIMSFPLTFFSLRHYFTFLVQILLTIIVERFECLKKFRPEQHENKNQITDGEGSDDENETKLDHHNDGKKDSLVNLVIKDKKDSLVELSISKNNIKEWEKSEDFNKNPNTITLGDVKDNKDSEEVNDNDQVNTENSTNSQELSEEESGSHHEIHHYVKLPQKLECLMVSGIFILIIFIGNIFAFLGATTANIFSFILPALFFLHFCNDTSLWGKIPSVFMIILGSLGLIVCVVSNIIELNSHH